MTTELEDSPLPETVAQMRTLASTAFGSAFASVGAWPAVHGWKWDKRTACPPTTLSFVPQVPFLPLGLMSFGAQGDAFVSEVKVGNLYVLELAPGDGAPMGFFDGWSWDELNESITREWVVGGGNGLRQFIAFIDRLPGGGRALRRAVTPFPIVNPLNGLSLTVRGHWDAIATWGLACP